MTSGLLNDSVRAMLLEELACNDPTGQAALVPVMKEHVVACNVARRLCQEGLAQVEYSEALALWLRRLDLEVDVAHAA